MWSLLLLRMVAPLWSPFCLIFCGCQRHLQMLGLGLGLPYLFGYLERISSHLLLCSTPSSWFHSSAALCFLCLWDFIQKPTLLFLIPLSLPRKPITLWKQNLKVALRDRKSIFFQIAPLVQCPEHILISYFVFQDEFLPEKLIIHTSLRCINSEALMPLTGKFIVFTDLNLHGQKCRHHCPIILAPSVSK